jgi:putative redox protein
MAGRELGPAAAPSTDHVPALTGDSARYTTAMSKPPMVVDLAWQHDLVFRASSAGRQITVDGDSVEGPSPVQALASAFVSCMAADVVYVLTKGRQPLKGLRAHLVAERAQENPHRILSLSLRFTIEGDVAPASLDRAIALSREKYCSVWHSMRQDITLDVSWETSA